MDISASQGVADQIDKEVSANYPVEKLIAEVTFYLKKIEQEKRDQPEKLIGQRTDPKSRYKLLRNPNRTQNTKLILLYLITFLSHLPLEVSKKGDPLNPFEQLKSFILKSIDLINEKDVTNAILKEHERLGLLTELNTWYYRGQIGKSHKAIHQVVDQAKAAGREGYRKLFLGLQKLSTFWFSVRNQDIERVRKSDILMYKLTRFLLEKYKERKK